MDSTLHEYLLRFDETAITSLLDRFRAIIDWETSETRRWKELEEISGIATHSWQKAYLGKQRPTSDMLEAIAQKWPKYAFWLMTGITDLKSRNVCPEGVNPWPASYEESKQINGGITWEDLIAIKPHLTKYLSEEPMDPKEEKKVDELLNNLNLSIGVDTGYRETVINKVFGKKQSRK